MKTLKELKKEMDAACIVSDSSWATAIKASSIADGSFNAEAAEAYLIYDDAYAAYDAARALYNNKLKEITDEDLREEDRKLKELEDEDNA